MELLEKLIEDNLNELRDKGINELVISRVGSILDLLLIDNVGDYRYRLDHNLVTATDEEGGALVVGSGIKYKTYLQVKPNYYVFYLLDKDDNVVMEAGRLEEDVKRIATYFYGYESNDPVYYDKTTKKTDMLGGLMIFCYMNDIEFRLLEDFAKLINLVDDGVLINFSLSFDENPLITFKYKGIKARTEFLDGKVLSEVIGDSGVIGSVISENDFSLIEKFIKDNFVKEVNMLKLEELSV